MAIGLPFPPKYEWSSICDAVLPTMGVQTALNCALDLVREGVLAKFDVEMIGAAIRGGKRS